MCDVSDKDKTACVGVVFASYCWVGERENWEWDIFIDVGCEGEIGVTRFDEQDSSGHGA